jgi:hypothetical protein
MAAEARVCQACALCCDGALFTRVPLTPDDAPPPQAGAITTEAGARYLPQPCAALSGTCCTVYASRPLVCRRYECLLLSALRHGEVTEAGALEVVRKARALEAGARRDAYLRVSFGRR